jgi:hypothetical protein
LRAGLDTAEKNTSQACTEDDWFSLCFEISGLLLRLRFSEFSKAQDFLLPEKFLHVFPKLNIIIYGGRKYEGNPILKKILPNHNLLYKNFRKREHIS